MVDIEKIPSLPGCYQFKDKAGRIIYVGKAKDLKKRVNQYFSKKGLDEKTKALASNIDSVDFIVTNNEIEALILENNLIKKHSPHYNISLKDSKTYSFIKITNENFPRLIVSRDKERSNDAFGPFVIGSDRKNILEFLNKSFKLRTCRKLPKKECLRFHIGICCAPCIGKISKKDYAELAKKARQALMGKNAELVCDLKAELKEYSISHEFEKAIVVREQIKAMEYLNEKQLIQRNKKFDEHFIDYIIDESRVFIILFKVAKGLVSEKQEFEFGYSPDFFSQFLAQYYSENDVPNEIILRKDIDDALRDFLKSKNPKSSIIVPKIGDKLKMLDLVKKNIRERFLKSKDSLLELRDCLNLEIVPNVIEGFDISHLSGINTAASMVQFRNGVPDKSNYRRFKIVSTEGEIDDFRAMHEAVLRRYKRLLVEGKDLPDLVLVDGGLGQVNSAKKALKSLNLDIPLIGIAKKFEEIWMPNRGSPIILGKKSDALKLLQRIRDEAHRFAINYNKNLRGKKLLD